MAERYGSRVLQIAQDIWPSRRPTWNVPKLPIFSVSQYRLAVSGECKISRPSVKEQVEAHRQPHETHDEKDITHRLHLGRIS